MTKLVNRAKMTTASTGTGSPITLGSAVDGYQTFAAAGVANSDVVRYVIEDGDAWEIGLGTYSSGTLTRVLDESSTGSLLNLSGSAVVYVTAAAEDIVQPSDLATVATTGAYSDLSGLPTIPAAYTNSDVDTHLNTGTASSGEVLSWTGSDYDWVAVSGGAADIDGLSDGWTNSTSVGLGTNALTQSGTSANNTAVGYNSQQYTFTGVGNTSIGVDSLNGPDFSNYNSAVGYRSLYWNNGDYNIGIGAYALYGSIVSFLNGDHNIGIGYQTGYDLDTGSHNFLGGHQAGANLTTGSNNVALGNGALDAATTAGENVAIGSAAGGSLTGATENTYVGGKAGSKITGSNNTAVGYFALYGGTSPSTLQSTAIGYLAGYRITSGIRNTFLGAVAGYDATTGITTGSNNTLVGYSAQASSATVSNEITLGDANITRFRIPAAGIDNTSAALSGTTPSVNVGARDTYTLTTSGNTTFTFTGAPSSGQVGTFSLIITAGGTHTLTWPASVDWAGGTAPDAPASGEKDIYTFMTVDGGTTWYGFLAGDAMA